MQGDPSNPGSQSEVEVQAAAAPSNPDVALASDSALGGLKAKLEMLRELGLLDRVHSVDGLVLFPPAVVRPALSEDEQTKLQADRERAADEALQRRRFGASGGMQPGAVPASEIERRQAAERAEEERARRQTRKLREAQAELDARRGA